MKHQLCSGSIMTPIFETKEELYEWIGKELDKCCYRANFKEKRKLYYEGIREIENVVYTMTKEAAQEILSSWDYTAYMQSEETLGFRFALLWWIKYGKSGKDYFSQNDEQVKRANRIKEEFNKPKKVAIPTYTSVEMNEILMPDGTKMSNEEYNEKNLLKPEKEKKEDNNGYQQMTLFDFI